MTKSVERNSVLGCCASVLLGLFGAAAAFTLAVCLVFAFQPRTKIETTHWINGGQDHSGYWLLASPRITGILFFVEASLAALGYFLRRQQFSLRRISGIVFIIAALSAFISNGALFAPPLLIIEVKFPAGISGERLASFQKKAVAAVKANPEMEKKILQFTCTHPDQATIRCQVELDPWTEDAQKVIDRIDRDIEMLVKEERARR